MEKFRLAREEIEIKAPEHGKQVSQPSVNKTKRRKVLLGSLAATAGPPKPYEVTVGRKLRELHPNVKAGTAFYYIKYDS